MNHAYSIETKAAEKYMLGELPSADRDSFEEHFFACPECARDICAGSQLVHGARAFFRKTLRPLERPWYFRVGLTPAIPLAAAFALVMMSVSQNAGPQVLPSAMLVPASRSELPSVSVPASARFFQLSLELPPGRTASRYDCELRDTRGRSLWKLQVSAPGATEDISLLVPAGRLSAGDYEIVLNPDVHPFRFRLNRP